MLANAACGRHIQNSNLACGAVGTFSAGRLKFNFGSGAENNLVLSPQTETIKKRYGVINAVPVPRPEAFPTKLIWKSRYRGDSSVSGVSSGSNSINHAHTVSPASCSLHLARILHPSRLSPLILHPSRLSPTLSLPLCVCVCRSCPSQTRPCHRSGQHEAHKKRWKLGRAGSSSRGRSSSSSGSTSSSLSVVVAVVVAVQ